VARFAARFGFAVAPETDALMRTLVASGELATLAPERVWQEIARGLMEPRPSRMLAALRECGALAALLPEVAALFGVPQPPAHHPEIDTGVHVAQALDWAAAHAMPLPARYAVLAHDLGKATSRPEDLPRHIAHEQRSVRLARKLSERLRVPQDCRDVAELTARFHGVVHRAAELRPAKLLDFMLRTDALRRPERLHAVLDACAADACSRPGRAQDYAPARIVHDALEVVRKVNVGAVARAAAAKKSKGRKEDGIADAVRAARLATLRKWKAAKPEPQRPS
jgi:tRNA nucleotidyltransferase (CCA-adding enzyme)